MLFCGGNHPPWLEKILYISSSEMSKQCYFVAEIIRHGWRKFYKLSLLKCLKNAIFWQKSLYHVIVPFVLKSSERRSRRVDGTRFHHSRRVYHTSKHLFIRSSVGAAIFVRNSGARSGGGRWSAERWCEKWLERGAEDNAGARSADPKKTGARSADAKIGRSAERWKPPDGPQLCDSYNKSGVILYSYLDGFHLKIEFLNISKD